MYGAVTRFWGEELVSASLAVCASILPRRILYIHTASASEEINITANKHKEKHSKVEVPTAVWG
jgi:hypothetical protein